MDPLHEHVPDRIDTARLVLRCPQEADAPALNAAVLETLPDLAPWMPWAQEAPSVERNRADCRRMQAKFLLRTDLAMFIFARGPDGSEAGFVGGCGLHRIDWTLRRFEIGYWCRISRQREGLITEAVHALTRLAFDTLQARRVEVRMDDTNERSWRVARSTGFDFEGLLRGSALAPGGELRDTRVYAKVRPIVTGAAPA